MASVLQNLSTTPVDGVILRPSVIADLSVWPLMQAFLSLVPSRLLVSPM